MMSVSQVFAMAWEHHQAVHLQQAEQLYRQILQLDANHVHAWHLLGVIACQTGRGNLAVDYLHAALRLNPDWAEAHNHLGIALQEQGKVAEAVASYQQALRLMPDYADAHNNLGNALREQGQLGEAVGSLEQALRLRPDYAEAHNNLGIALQGLGKFAEAVVHLEQALRLRPDYPEAHNNLGTVLCEEGKMAEAVIHWEQALRLRPDYANAHNNLGRALLEQGKMAEAVASYQQALRLRPGDAEAHNNLSMLWLLLGNFEQGWPEYEWRLQMKDFPPALRPQPCWDGRPLDGKTILLYAEQGLGDTLQFIRYAAVVKQRGGTVVAECQPALLRVLAGCAGIDHLLPQGGPLPACDVRAPMLSLPLLCGTTVTTIPAEVPYLVADRSRIEHWRDRLAVVSGFKVGICWQGNPRNKNDRRRSVPLAQFAPLAAIRGVHLVSLQKGPGVDQLGGLDFDVVDLGSKLDEEGAFVDTAAVMQSLDLLISVDSAVAHLAGALGMPVWLALSFSPAWRWLLEREDSPWYPSMRLFRQPQPGQWPAVFERIAKEARKLVTSRGALSPG